MIVGQERTSSPGTYIDPSVELGRNDSLIVLNTLREFLRHSFPTVFLRVFDRFVVGLGGFYAFLQALDLVDRQSRLSEEQITHGDV